MLAMLWNWNQRFFGMKDRGVYLAVRILLRVYVCAGRPLSSLNSSGNGKLKRRVRGPGPSGSLLILLASLSGPDCCWTPLVCFRAVDAADTPDCLFSVEVVRLCLLPIRERRLMLLLFTVSFRVAHLDLLVALLARSCWAPASPGSLRGAIPGARRELSGQGNARSTRLVRQACPEGRVADPPRPSQLPSCECQVG